MAAHAAEPNGTPGGGASAFAAEWFTGYTEYLKRASSKSTSTVELYQQITERIARGALSPAAAQDLLASFVRARGTAYAEQLSQLLTRFFTELVRVSSAYGQALGQAVFPGADVPPLPPLSFDTTDPSGWFQQLSEYSRQLSGIIAAGYQAVIDRAAAGQLTPDELEHAAAAHLQRRLPEWVAELSRLYFELLNDLADLRAGAEQEFLQGVLEGANGGEAGRSFELTLTAPPGATATASVSIANSRDELAQVRYHVTEVRRADGVGPAFTPDVTFAPETMELAPGAEARLEIGLHLADGSYEPDVAYAGTLEITGHGDPRLEVPLRIVAAAEAPTTAP